MPSQKDGMVSPATLAIRIAASAPCPRSRAITQPAGTASPAPNTSASTVSCTVGQTWPAISPATGLPVHSEVPRSPCSTLAIQPRYCTAIG